MINERLRGASETVKVYVEEKPVPRPPVEPRRLLPRVLTAAVVAVVAIVAVIWLSPTSIPDPVMDVTPTEDAAMVRQWVEGALAGRFDEIDDLTHGEFGEPEAMAQLAQTLYDYRSQFGDPVLTIAPYRTSSEVSFTCLDVAYDGFEMSGGVVVREWPGIGRKLWEFRTGMTGCTAGPEVTTTLPATTPSLAPPTTTATSADFDLAGFMDSKLFGAFSPEGSRVGVVVLAPPDAEEAVDNALAGLTELEGYSIVSSDRVSAAMGFADYRRTSPPVEDWVAFGLIPRFGDSPTDAWVDALQNIPAVRAAIVAFEPLAQRLPPGWSIVADLPFPAPTGAIVEQLSNGIVMVQRDATYLIESDGTWQGADEPPISIPNSCCAGAAGFVVDDRLILTDETREDAWIFDSDTLTWRQTGPRPWSSFVLGSAVIDDELWLVEGAARTNAPTSSVAVLDPSTGQWRESEPVPTPISVGGVTTDGEALLVAGTRQDQNNGCPW